MTIQCPKCKAENPDTKQFCGDCGTQLTPGKEAPPYTETLEAPKEELATGATFAGRYQIIEELGKGGMGRVYKATDTKIREKIALKLVKPDIAKDKKTIERFSNELRLSRKIRHKNVCGMFDLGEEKGTHYITMEFVPGEDLRSSIRRFGKLPIGKSISIAKQICEGLAEAHRLGVIHRDLKSSNIMIDKEGNARIMDFGIARSLQAKGITGAGVMIGTPEYMSPEQVEGKDVDQRSDIYSLGVILYEMVTGRVPFDGETPFTIGVKHKSEEPKNPKELNTQISDDLNRVILRCLEKDEKKRYQSAGEVQSELQNIETGIPTTEKVIPERKPLTSKEITLQFSLKRIFIPVSVILALAIMAILIWQFLPEKEAIPIALEQPSVAVLPFLDLSPQKDQEYFCDGMTDEVIARLSTFKGWKVIPRTSMMRYKNTEKDIKEIGAELNVATILEGSMRKEGDDIRVNAKLIRIEDSSSLWSDTYDEKLESIFTIQSDLAERIAEALKVELSPEEKEKLEKNPTENLTAYDYYLKGRQYYLNYRQEDNELAIELFKKALEFDPDFALAYSGLGDSYAQRTIKFGFSSKWLDESIHAAEGAISLDPDLSEGYKALGLAYLAKGMSRKCIEANQKAIELNPNNVDAITNLGYIYCRSGSFEKAVEYFRRAFLLDPTDPWNYINFGDLYINLDDYAKAEHYLKTALDLQPHHYDVNEAIMTLYLSQGKNQQAIDHSQRWLSISPNNHYVLSYAGQAELYAGHYEQAQKYYKKSVEIQMTRSNSTGLGYIYWKMGKYDEAQKLLNQSLELCQKQIEQGSEYYGVQYNIAAIHAIQSNKVDAYDWLKKAIDAGWPYFRFGERDPKFENIRTEERFKQMMAGVKKKIDNMRKKIEQKEKQE